MREQGKVFMLCAAFFYLIAMGMFLRGKLNGGLIWLGLGTAWFCVGMVFRKRK